MDIFITLLIIGIIGGAASVAFLELLFFINKLMIKKNPKKNIILYQRFTQPKKKDK